MDKLRRCTKDQYRINKELFEVHDDAARVQSRADFSSSPNQTDTDISIQLVCGSVVLDCSIAQ